MSKKIKRFGRTCLTYVLVFAIVFSFVMSTFAGLNLTASAAGESTGGASYQSLDFSQLQGDGTASSPYKITNAQELLFAVNNTTLIGDNADQIPYFKLVNDIVVNDVSDIANWTDDTQGLLNWIADNAFVGHLDGNYKDIVGLYLVCKTERSSWVSTGFIKTMASGSSIKNLDIRDAYISAGVNMDNGNADIGVLVGGIQGKSDIEISGVTVHDVTVKNNSAQVGALIGRMWSNARVVVSNCATYNINIVGNVEVVGGLYSDGWANQDNYTYSCKFVDCFTSGLPISAQNGAFRYTNVYSDWNDTYAFGYKRANQDEYFTNELATLYYKAPDLMKGAEAVSNMGLSSEIWLPTSTYPVIKNPDGSNLLSGEGTQEKPFEITTAEQLKVAVNNTTLIGADNDQIPYYKLMNDIVINDITDIANWADDTQGLVNWNPNATFVGHLDGNYKDVIGLYISYDADRFNTSNLGLISRMASGSSVSNLTVRNGYVSAGAASTTVGLLVGNINSAQNVSISGCEVYDMTVKNIGTVGALVGVSYLNGNINISNCATYNINVVGTPSALGGIYGDGWMNWDGASSYSGIHTCKVKDCFTSGLPISKQDGGFTFTNVYTDQNTSLYSGVTKLDTSSMKGPEAVSNMGLSSVWEATDSSYPVIAIPFEFSMLKGNGTETDPYQITNAKELKFAVNNTTLIGENADQIPYFKLMNDIVLNDTSDIDSWTDTTEGLLNWTADADFVGHLDGNYKDIVGLYLVSKAVNSSWKSTGFIKTMASGSSIKNLEIKDGYVSAGANMDNGNADIGVLVGGIQGKSDINISGVTVHDIKVKNSSGVGALIGRMWSNARVVVTNCATYNITLEGNPSYYGGLYSDGWANHDNFSYSNKFVDCFTSGLPISQQDGSFKYTNVYTDINENYAYANQSAYKDGIYYLATDSMKGANAVSNMGLSSAVWETTEDSYPVIKTPISFEMLNGEGTETAPYAITNADELLFAVNNTKLIGENNDQIPYFRLMNDIVINDITDIDSWTDNTEGLFNWSSNAAFVGHLDGNYKDIIGLYIAQKSVPENWQSTGFIKTMASGSSIKNFDIRDGYVSAGVNMDNGKADIGVLVGGIQGKSDINISGIVVHDVTIKNNSTVGALIGRMWNNARVVVSNCATYDITIVSTQTVHGGLYADGWSNQDNFTYSCKFVDCFTSGLPISAQNGAFRYTNVYSDWNDTYAFGYKRANQDEYFTNELATLNYKAPDLMKGASAVSNMGLSSAVWETTENSYPVIKTPINFSLLGGKGTQAEPYEITNADELMFAVNNTEKIGDNYDQIPYFKIMNDIEINDITDIDSWTDDTEGLLNWSSNAAFVGHLDGDHKDIIGLYLVQKSVPSSWQSTGFIKNMESGSSLSNINIRDAYISAGVNMDNGKADIGVLVGGIQSKTDISITGCVVHDVKIKNTAGTGALIGRMWSNKRLDLANCATYNITIEGNPGAVGGIYSDGWDNWDGGHYTCKISDCFTSGLPISQQDGSFRYSNVYTDWDETYAFGYKRENKDEYTYVGQGDIHYIPTASMKGPDAVDNMKLKPNQWSARTDDYPECIILPYDYNGVPGAAWSGGKALTFAGGDGTQENPWEIDTPERFVKMLSDYTGEEHWFVITKDLIINDTSAPDWYTATSNMDWVKGKVFTGHVDGKGHKITGLYIDNTVAPTSVGLIPQVDANASVANINLDKCYLTSPSSTAGMLVGSTTHDCFVRISGCNVSNAVVGTCYGFGGIIGGSSIGMCVIDYCTFDGQLISEYPSSKMCGGIVADSWGNVIVSNCVSRGINAFGQLTGTVHAIYSDVDQKNARDTGADVNVIKPEEMTGSAAKDAMPELNWDRMKTNANGVPTYDGLVDLSDEGTAGEVGKVWSGAPANKYAGGTGTEDDPYIIETAEQLYRFSLESMSRANSKDLHYLITEDIYLNDVSDKNWKDNDNLNYWLSAGFHENGVNRYFSGHLDGGYHVIYGMYSVINEANNCTALIPRADQGATVKCLGISEAYLANEYSGISFVAPFVGYVERVKGEVIDADVYNAVKFSECFVDETVEVYSRQYAAGFVASSRVKVEFDNCYSNVYIDRTVNYSAAFIAEGYYGVVNHPFLFSNCYAKPKSTWTKFSRIPVFQQETSRENILPEGTLDNCYYYGSNAIIVEPLDYLNMRGDKAKTYMKGFDFENVWQTVDGGTPVLKGFANADKFSDTEDVYSTITFFTGTDELKLPEMTGKASSPVTLPAPEREGYFFDGWYVFDDYNCEYDFGIYPVEDIGLYAKWITNSVTQNFENYTNTEYDFASDYQYYRPGVLDYTGEKVHAGGKAMLRLGKSAEEQDFILNAEDPVAVGEEYKIRFWVASDVADTKATISLVHYTWPDYQDPNLGVEKLIDYKTEEVGEWTVYTCKFKAKTPWIGIRTTGNARIFFDDFFILPVDGVMDNTSKTNDYDYFYSLGEPKKTETTKTESSRLFSVDTLRDLADSVMENRTVSVAVLATVLLAAASLVVLSKVYFSNLEKSFKSDIED